MYRVLGADGKEYGPVNGEVLRQWITEGRAHAQTRVKSEGSAEWQTLASVPEFEAEFAAAPGAPPPLAVAPAETKTCGLAIASLVLGILGLCGITALVGLILGIVALVKINRSGGRLSGQGLAIAGICVSGVMLLLSIPFMAGLTLPALARAKHRAQAISERTQDLSPRLKAERVYCVNNMKQLALAVKIYTAEHNGQLPPAATWCDAIQSYVSSPQVFQCPSAPGRRCAYAFNARLDGKKEKEIDPQTVLLFESDAGWNGTGGADALKPHKHSGRTVNVAIADGSVRPVPRSELDTLRWEP
jgi:prepilin-type processing-associated H-X9-DG protein